MTTRVTIECKGNAGGFIAAWIEKTFPDAIVTRTNPDRRTPSEPVTWEQLTERLIQFTESVTDITEPEEAFAEFAVECIESKITADQFLQAITTRP